LAFAHDPDADRLAVLARTADGTLRSLSGDEVGALLGDFLLSQHPAPQTTLLASTLVSGGLLEQIASGYGASFVRSPTGFKWIAALARERAKVEQREPLFGYEEALGYAFFSMAEDKDGIAALAVLCRLAQALKADNESLLTKLASLNRQHGVFATRQISHAVKGVDAAQRLGEIMERFRALSAEALLGAGATLVDYAREPAGFPLLVFAQHGPGPLSGTRVCVRPSGTEPKLKIYLHARELPAAADDLDAARVRAEARLTLVANALAPCLSR
jgi:phosphomannomutase